MQLQITSSNIEPDEKLNELVNKKFEYLGKMDDRIGFCKVVLRQETPFQKCFFVEAKIELPKTRFFAHYNAETFEIALDSVINDLEHQLSRYKEEREEIW